MITIRTYKLNCQRNVVNKTIGTTTAYNLVIVFTLYGNFKNAVALKNPIIDIDITDTSYDFNYVYIVELNRYYFVEKLDLVSKNVVRLSLAEDVLMSHASLIKSQNAFVTRSAEKGVDTIVDDRYPLESVKTIEYITPTPTATGNLTNVTLDTNIPSTIANQKRNVLVAIAMWPRDDKIDLPAPTGTDLPSISWSASPSVTLYLCTLHEVQEYLNGLYISSEYVTYLNSILLLPFDLTIPYNQNIDWNFDVGGNGLVCSDGEIRSGTIPEGTTVLRVKRVLYRTSPYLILADFTFPSATKWYEKEPYTNYEMYIPFVGWIPVDIEAVQNCRIIIYYTIDYSTGNATVYVYNITKQQIIYTTTCQIGSKLSVSSSNNSDLARERENIELNTLMSSLTAGVSILGGTIAESPKMIVSGILSAGKGIASQVNAQRMLVQRGHVSYGSGESGYHGLMSVKLRKTYYKAVMTTTAETDIYDKIQGKPMNNYVSLSSFSDGYYIEVGDIQFNPKFSDIYNDEINEIVTLLQNGVIL